MSRAGSRKLSLILSVLLLVGCGFLLFQILRAVKSAEKQFGLSPLSLYQLATDGEAMVKSDNGRVNILLLGIGGGTHEGPDLTDTIIVLSFNTVGKNLALISIPRDIWSDSLQDRVNSAYHYGEERKEGGGITLSSIIVEDIIGIPIHYAIVIDFSQFESLIDYIGGIDVVVPKAFTDTEYPISGRENDDCDGDITYACRYQTIQFDQGLLHMDGKRALIYVRSRHADGDEGSDFARGRRQQDVIVAIKTKIISLEPWFHPEMSMKLFQSFDKATKTDLTIGQLLALGKLGMSVKGSDVQKISIEPYLTQGAMDTYGRYVLEPEESYEEIHSFIQKSLEE